MARPIPRLGPGENGASGGTAVVQVGRARGQRPDSRLSRDIDLQQSVGRSSGKDRLAISNVESAGYEWTPGPTGDAAACGRGERLTPA